MECYSKLIKYKIDNLNKKSVTELETDLHHVYGVIHGLEMFSDNNGPMLCDKNLLKAIIVLRQDIHILKEKIIINIYERMNNVVAR